MIDLKQRPDVGWNLLLCLSLMGTLVGIWFGFVQPKSTGSLASSRASTPAEIQKSALDDENLASKAEDQVKARTWDVGVDVLGSQVLDQLNQTFAKSHVQITSFRSGKAFAAANLQEAPFTIAIEGAFPDVVEAVKAIEDPESKIALNQFQVNSGSDSNRVAATLTVTCFLSKVEEK